MNAREKFTDPEHAMQQQRLLDMGILFQIKQICSLRTNPPMSLEELEPFACAPVWSVVEQGEGHRDARQVVGEGIGIPELVVSCTWRAIGGGYEGMSVPVLDEELSLDPLQQLQLGEWADERPRVVFKLG